MEDKTDLKWRKSTYSSNGGGECVEVANDTRSVLVRDTNDRTGPVLRFSPAAWLRFAEQVKRSLAPETYRVFLAAPVSRTVAQIELPSTRQPTIFARCSVLSRFTILTIMLEGSDIFGASIPPDEGNCL